MGLRPRAPQCDDPQKVVLGAQLASTVSNLARAANEDQVRQAIEETLSLTFLLGFRTYPQRARTWERT